MKTSFLSFVIILLLCSLEFKAQDVNSLRLLAHYTLIETAEDATGNYDTMRLINCPYQAMEGIYSNGLRQIHPMHSFAGTPKIDEIDFDLFGLSLQFKLDTLGITNPIILVGGLWRWLGAEVIGENIALIYNGTRLTSNHALEMNTWYNLVLKYSTMDSTARLYIDDQMILMKRYQIISAPNDKDIMAYNGSSGISYKGYLKNLRVFGPFISGSEMVISDYKQVVFYPTVVKDILHCTIPHQIKDPHRFLVYNSSGKLVGEVPILSNTTSDFDIILPHLSPGTYYVSLRGKNRTIHTQPIIKME